MSSYTMTETFFRPDSAWARETRTLPASLHNALQLTLTRSLDASVFVPIRSMQYLAIVEREEVVFVDGQGGYAYQDGRGGRLIRIAWRPTVGRHSLSAPVGYEIIYYSKDIKQVQARLVTELGSALEQQLERHRRHQDQPTDPCRVLSFRRTP